METETKASSSPAAAGGSSDELWSGLPSSNLYKQKKLTGWREAGEEAPEGEAAESRVPLLESDRDAELRAFLEASGLGFDAVLLGAYHLVLQWLLDDFESLIGCCLLGAAPRAALRASYVYAEDEDPLDGLLGDIEQQLRTGRSLDVDPGDVSSWPTRRAPIFFYIGGDGGPGPEAPHPAAALRPNGRVVVAAGAGPTASAHLLMPMAASQAIGIDDFQRRYARALSALLTRGCSRVGDIKSHLGEGVQVPYRQLEEMQRRLIALWAKVLGIAEDTLTENSNYYEVGGTSLNAFKLMNRMRVEFQRDVSIWEIIENPTIQGLARVLLKR